VGATPIALFVREHAEAWQTIRMTAASHGGADEASAVERTLSPAAHRLLDALRSRGALFLRELIPGRAGRVGQVGAVTADEARRDHTDVFAAVAELVAAGLVASDGFAGLRAIAIAHDDHRRLRDKSEHAAGRWSLLRRETPAISRDAAVELQARSLLRRYGVMFRRLLTREANAAPWRELTRVFRRLEARGEIRGGRFVSGMSGEQFALPEAVERLREIRRTAPDGRLLTMSAADPASLTGIVTSGERVRAAAATRVVYRDGVAVAVLEGDYMRPLAEIPAALSADVASALAGRRLPAVVSGFVGRGRKLEATGRPPAHPTHG
jgi:ATP-dependent Lhr-like helicase